MQFSGEMAALQRRVSSSVEGADRRRAVLDVATLEPGSVALDVGCGGGLLVRDLASLPVPELRVIGIDPSPEQVAAAEVTCEGLAAAELRVGDARALDLADGECTFVTSTQTLEYIAEVDEALAEIARVTGAGGRVALISVLWDQWRFYGAEEALTLEVLDVWRAHCHHQSLPAELPGRLTGIGFADVEQRQIGFYNNSFDEAHYGGSARLIAAGFARGAGMDPERVDAWLEQLAAAEAEGRFGFASMPVLTVARRL